MAKAFNSQVQDKMIGHGVDLLRFAETTREKVAVVFERMAQELDKRLRTTDLGYGPYKNPRVNRFIKESEKTIRAAYTKAAAVMRDDMRELAVHEGKALPKLLNGLLKRPFVNSDFDSSYLRGLADQVLIQGGPAEDWWAKATADAINRFRTQIRMGVLAKEGTNALSARIRGTPLRRKRVLMSPEGSKVTVDRYAGGMMDSVHREAYAFIRTGSLAVGNSLFNELIEDNGRLMKGVMAVAVLDNRTSALCRGRDRSSWDLDGHPFPDSPQQIEFPGPPPWHWNCRSILVPIFRPWSELSRLTGLSEPTKAIREALDGSQPEGTDYETWLRQQPEETAKEILGPGRYELWKAGKLTLAQMIDQSGRALTLEQLRERLSEE